MVHLEDEFQKCLLNLSELKTQAMKKKAVVWNTDDDLKYPFLNVVFLGNVIQLWKPLSLWY
jgi:hypothetical protein